MYGVSLTSGQPVTIVQKFPDLLQQVVFEVCEWVSTIYLIYKKSHCHIFNFYSVDMLSDRKSKKSRWKKSELEK